MQQALECIERLNAHGWILADYETEVYAAITTLREALAREHALHDLARLGQEIEQEPDRRVLQAEGKHPAPCARHCEAKAFEIEIRSLKSRQEPVAMDWQRGSVPLGGNSCSIVSQKTIPFEFRQPAAQPEQEVSCRFCHSKKGCWAWQCYSCGEIDDVQQPTPPAAQRKPPTA
jgi:hypothetical protein